MDENALRVFLAATNQQRQFSSRTNVIIGFSAVRQVFLNFESVSKVSVDVLLRPQGIASQSVPPHNTHPTLWGQLPSRGQRFSCGTMFCEFHAVSCPEDFAGMEPRIRRFNS